LGSRSTAAGWKVLGWSTVSPSRAVRFARIAVGMAGCAAPLLLVDSAHAYCRTYTCQAKKNCENDELGCPVGGRPLYWPRRCFSYSVQQDASPLRHITLDSAQSVLDRAYSTWTAAQCEGGQSPSIAAIPFPSVACANAEFNKCDGNANVWIFRDEEWPYDDAGGTLAQTWVHFDTRTGEIYDADVEVNTAMYSITTSTLDQREQFVAIATHEIGHVLGLDHATSSDSTMYAYYSSRRQISELSQDDVDGLCAIYPSDRQVGACNAEPYHGFASECGTVECKSRGCSTAGPSRGGNGAPWAVGVAMAAFGLARTRRRSRPA
jgi:hypothetical protein